MTVIANKNKKAQKRSNFLFLFLQECVGFPRSIMLEVLRVPYKGVRFNVPDKVQNRRFSSGIKNLTRRGALKKLQNGSYIITPHGVKAIRSNLMQYHQLIKSVWDGKWRIVLFDIPSGHNSKRDTLRRRLRFNGFLMVQKSVFVFPYSCEEEIGGMCQTLELGEYVNIITVEDIGSWEDTARQYFELSK